MKVGIERGYPGDRWQRHALRLGACVASLATLTSCAVVNKNASPTPTVTKNVKASTEVFKLPSVQPVIMTMLGEPDAEIETRKHQVEDHVKKSLARIARILALSEESHSAGKVLPSVEYEIQAITDSDSGRPCIAVDQLKTVSEKAVADMPVVILPVDVGVCGYYRAIGIALDTNTIVMRARNAVDNSQAEALFAHEFGHTQGLGHNGALVPVDPQDVTANNGSTDIGELIGRYRFATESTGDTQVGVSDVIDQYAGPSVMGRVVSDSDAVDSSSAEEFNYSFDDLVYLREDVYLVANISQNTIEATYNLSVQPGTLRSIKFKLPEDHPLRQIPGGEQLESIAMGLDSTTPDKPVKVDIIATASNRQTYDIQTSTFVLDKKNKDRDWVAFYTDRTIGFRVDVRMLSDESVQVHVVAIK